MSSQGSVIARVYTSDAYIPLSGVQVSFSQTNASGVRHLLALRVTDSSGLTDPVYVETPDTAASLSPGSDQKPYTTLEIATSLPGFSSVLAQNVQVFPGIETVQDLQLQPVPAADRDRSDTYRGNAQNL